MVAELTVWIMLKALFFMIVILGPLALVIIAAEKRLKKTPNGVFVMAIVRLSFDSIAFVILAAVWVWTWRHEGHAPHDWLLYVLPILFPLAVRQDWLRLRELTGERRARALADTANDLPSGFRYECDTKT